MILRMGDDAQESSAPTMALEGQRIGNRYQLLGLLGTGEQLVQRGARQQFRGEPVEVALPDTAGGSELIGVA